MLIKVALTVVAIKTGVRSKKARYYLAKLLVNAFEEQI